MSMLPSSRFWHETPRYSPRSPVGKELAAVDAKAEIEIKKSLRGAEVAEFEAQLRGRYTQNRMEDAKEILYTVVNEPNDAVRAGLAELAGIYLQGEKRAMRNLT